MQEQPLPLPVALQKPSAQPPAAAEALPRLGPDVPILGTVCPQRQSNHPKTSGSGPDIGHGCAGLAQDLTFPRLGTDALGQETAVQSFGTGVPDETSLLAVLARATGTPWPELPLERHADGFVGWGGFPNAVTPVDLWWGLAGWVGDPTTPKLLQKIPTTDRIYHSTAAIALQIGCLMICWRWWEFLARLEPRVQQEVCAVGLINGFALVVDWPEDCELPRQT